MLATTTISVDLAVISTGIGIIVTLLGGILYIAKILNSIENRFIAIESRRELDVHKVKSALKFLKYETDMIKGWLSRETSFQDRHTTPSTGADFLNE